MNNELYHYGVKGMKWKDHKYKAIKNGEYIYDIAKYNLQRQGREDIVNANVAYLRSASSSTNIETGSRPSSEWRRKNGQLGGIAASVSEGMSNAAASALYKRQGDAYMARYNKYSLKGIASTKAKKGKERTSAAIEKLRLKAKNKVIEQKTKNGLQVKEPAASKVKRKYNTTKDNVKQTTKKVYNTARTIKGIYDYNHDRLTPASYDLVTGGSSSSSSGVKRRKKKK